MTSLCVSPTTQYAIGYIATSKSKIAPMSYRVRAVIARRHGARLYQIILTKKNCALLKRQDQLEAYYWDGRRLKKLLIRRPAACYELTGRHATKEAQKNLKVMSERGTLFVNPRQIRETIADKWNQYRLLRKTSVSVPRTALLGRNTLAAFVQRHSVVFVKPRIGSQGKGQIVVRRYEDGYVVKYSRREKTHTLKTVAEVVSLVCDSKKHPDAYIVQQGVDVAKLEERVFDFRVVCQRARKGRLHMTACYLRVGSPESHQANISSKGHPLDPAFVFKNWRSLRATIKQVAFDVCAGFDESLGELGVDLVMTRRGKLLCIEVNTRPGNKGFQMLRRWAKGSKSQRALDAVNFQHMTRRDRAKWNTWLTNFRARPILYCMYLIDRAMEH